MAQQTIVAVVQARMTSSRLPGKPLLKIGNKSLLGLMLYRIRKSALLSDVIVATSTLPESDAIAKECKTLKTECYRGSENDVLSRFVAIARRTNADHIVRICGDEPFVDPAIIDGVIKSHLRSGADYTSTALKRTFPKGADVEVMTRQALYSMDALAHTTEEREHVTLRLVRDRSFTKNNVTASARLRLPTLNICIDTAQDLRYIRKLHERLGDDISTEQLITFVKQHPHIARKPLLVFRADGGWKTGMGHYSVGLALARRLQAVMDVTFFGRADAAARTTIVNAGFSFIPLKSGVRAEAADIVNTLDHLRPEIYVTDVQTTKQDYAPELRKLNIKTVASDVLGTLSFTPDIIINRSRAPARISRYPKHTPTKFFIGPQYAILADAYARVHGHSKKLHYPPKNVVLTFGGSDPKNLTVKALKAIDLVPGSFTVTVIIGAAYKHQNELDRALAALSKPVRVLKNIPNLADTLHSADAAVTAGGFTLHELACTGTPALVLSLEPEQLVNAKEFANAGTIIDAGWGPDVSVNALAKKIEQFFSDRAALARMSTQGKKLVDGKGLARVVQLLRGLLA